MKAFFFLRVLGPGSLRLGLLCLRAAFERVSSGALRTFMLAVALFAESASPGIIVIDANYGSLTR